MSRNSYSDIYFFLDWCPYEDIDYESLPDDSIKLSPIVFCSDADNEKSIINKVYTTKGNHVDCISCAARSDGILIFAAVIQRVEKDHEKYVAPDYLAVGRYISKKLKETVLKHEHVFHNSSISKSSSHDPVLLSFKSLKNLVTEERHILDTNEFICLSHEQRAKFLMNIASNDVILSSLKAARSNTEDTNKLALDCLYSFIVNHACKSKHSIERMLEIRKKSIKSLQQERIRGIFVISAIYIGIATFSFYVSQKYNLFHSNKNFFTNYLIFCTIFWYVFIVLYSTNVGRKAYSGKILSGVTYIARNAIGYSHSAKYFSTIYSNILSRSGIDSEMKKSQHMIRDARIDSTINKLHILVDSVQTKEAHNTNKLIYLIAIFTFILAGVGIAIS